MAEVSLELLQAMLQRVLDELALLRADMTEVKLRLTNIEQELAVMRRYATVDAETRALAPLRIDRPDGRIDRIERRLELRDA